MARAREPRFLGSARRPRMHTHRERAQARMCTHVCERGRARSVCRAARTHRPDDGAIPILGAHGCAQTERSPRRERPLPAPARAHSTQGSGDGGSGRRAARRWARCVHGSRAPRSACTRAALSTQPTRSAGAGRQATWFPARSAAHRGAHQLLSCDGLSGVNGSVASRGVSAAYTIHVRVYIFATARAAAAHRRREASHARREFEKFRFRNGPGPPRHS